MLLLVGIVVATLVVIGLEITWFKRKPKSQIRSDYQPTTDLDPKLRGNETYRFRASVQGWDLLQELIKEYRLLINEMAY